MRVGDSLTAFVGAKASYRSSSNTSVGENPNFRFKAYTVADLRPGIGAADQSWKLEAWGRNVADTFYLTNVAFNVDAVFRTTGMPATNGLTLRTRF